MIILITEQKEGLHPSFPIPAITWMVVMVDSEETRTLGRERSSILNIQGL
jgi:hypothetical protein